MSLSAVAKNVEKFAISNSPAILTGLAVTGTVTSAVLAGKASYKASAIIAEAELERQINEHNSSASLEPVEKFQMVWTLYIPAVGACVTTVVAIIAANQIGTRRAAAAMAAYSMSEKAFGEYREKVLEKVGEKKEQVVRDELAQDRVNNTPVPSQLVMIGDNEVLCFDQFSGRYFNSTMEKIKQAQNNINFKILNDNYASVNDFYEELGLDYISAGDEFGWTTDKKLDVGISTVLSEDQRPCIAVEFYTRPFKDYSLSFPH